ncbi:UPF0755 protein [Granulicatella balaenopterae]|uniref:Endolytic murein transglycosylase n=1 Tax=Granulicatella balaenopterae TaxID=137733 RepID=A0A1H9K1X3_9LACT|nr:endolytic transglycosylase MltG [Granulicatella balaenopterae]SEQ93090.1 UPF0755 protein [Granulicatella balaenopterae]
MDKLPMNQKISNRKKREKEKSIVSKIVTRFILFGLLLILIVVIIGSMFVSNALKPVDPNQTDTVEVQIPTGASVSQISQILKDGDLVHNASVFKYYVKMKNVPGFKAGYYQLSPSMSVDEIITSFIDGGTDQSSAAKKLLVREGEQIVDIANEVSKVTDYTAEEFLAKVNDQDFYQLLVKEFPQLLGDSVKYPNVRYRLEGYLFPATYDIDRDKTLQMIITEMVQKTNQVMSKYYEKIAEGNLDVHQILTLASLVEKEGTDLDDRKKIASVFYNRLNADMMLQTDVAVSYALEEHKEALTYEDLEVDSPYNLYKYKGLGPGPFNNPGEQAIAATINPDNTDYYYFLADINTKKVYFAKTYEEHLELKKQYID